MKHAHNATGDDRTLCGVAAEGTHDDGFDPPQFVVIGEYVTCPDCKRIIEHCQAAFNSGYKRRG